MEEVTKCSYINCLDTEENGRIFHELPVCDTGLCVKWLINSGHEDLVGKDFNALRSTRFFVCSNHFTNDCYIAKGTLKDNAVPRPHWNTKLTKRDNLQIQHKYNQDFNSSFASIPSFTNLCGKYISTQVPKQRKKFVNSNNSTYGKQCREQWCRTCATKKPNLINMKKEKKSAEMSLLSKLKLLIEINDNDHLPMNICLECVKKLEQSFHFFQQIYVADNTLRQIFSQKKNVSPSKYNGFAEKKIKSNTCETAHKQNADVVTDIQEFTPNVAVETEEKTVCDKNSTELCTDQTVAIKEETVFSLLTNTCHSDEELDWTDVLNVMKDKNGTSIPLQDSPDTQVKCKYCSSKFRLRRQLKTHLMIEHPEFAQNMCIDCVTSYKTKSELIEHRSVSHNEQRYQCDYCKKSFTSKITLGKHMTKFHLIVQRNYSCKRCGKRFPLKQNLCEHMKKVHRMRIRSARGKAISKTTKNSQAGIRNKDSFTGKQRKIGYRCKLCSNLFSNAERLAAHLKSHSIRDWESYKAKVFNCRECTAKMFSTLKLRIHEMKCHLARRKDFRCLLCRAKPFRTVEEYNAHISVHCKRLKMSNPLS